MKGLCVVRRGQRTAILAVRPSSPFGKIDRQFLLPHTDITGPERMPVGPQSSHQEMICLGNAVLPEKSKYYSFALAKTKQMLLLAGGNTSKHILDKSLLFLLNLLHWLDQTAKSRYLDH